MSCTQSKNIVVPGKDNCYVICVLLFYAVLCRELYCYLFLLWNQIWALCQNCSWSYKNLYLLCPSLEWAFWKLVYRSYCLKNSIMGTDRGNKIFCPTHFTHRTFQTNNSKVITIGSTAGCIPSHDHHQKSNSIHKLYRTFEYGYNK